MPVRMSKLLAWRGLIRTNTRPVHGPVYFEEGSALAETWLQQSLKVLDLELTVAKNLVQQSGARARNARNPAHAAMVMR